jgi:hypothetical protein
MVVLKIGVERAAGGVFEERHHQRAGICRVTDVEDDAEILSGGSAVANSRQVRRVFIAVLAVLRLSGRKQEARP